MKIGRMSGEIPRNGNVLATLLSSTGEERMHEYNCQNAMNVIVRKGCDLCNLDQKPLLLAWLLYVHRRFVGTLFPGLAMPRGRGVTKPNQLSRQMTIDSIFYQLEL